jgi:DNA-directed RNA polymerase subunit K/omega
VHAPIRNRRGGSATAGVGDFRRHTGQSGAYFSAVAMHSVGNVWPQAVRDTPTGMATKHTGQSSAPPPLTIASSVEKASLLGLRAAELAAGAPTLLPTPLPIDMYDPVVIAEEELRRGLLKPERAPFTHGSEKCG